MASPIEKIRIAINGGGLAGALLFHALLEHSHLDVHIFERATTFEQAGAGISITRNALNALDLLSAAATQCLERAGAVHHLEALLRLAQGPDTGDIVSDIVDGSRLVKVVARADFLRELLAASPRERMHACKALQDIRYTNADRALILLFADGTEHECDILIGADGIHSRVRALVLGENSPVASPVPSGWWVIQAVKSYADMRTALGTEIVNLANPRELGWIGDHAFLYTTLLSEGNQVQLVLCGCHDGNQASNEWEGKISAQQIRNLVRDWPPQLRDAVDELMCSKESQDALYLWEHLHAPKYTSGSLCIVGDAAHSMTPWQGSGGGMSIEDSLILSTLLARAKTPTKARTALQFYDHLRRERTQRVANSSRGTGLILTNQDPSVGLSAEKIRAKLQNRWNFILDFDIEGHRDDAIRMMERQDM